MIRYIMEEVLLHKAQEMQVIIAQKRNISQGIID